MPKALKHVHRYRRVRGNKRLYFCTLPGCYHKYMREFLVGKQSLCSICGKPFILTFPDLDRAMPRCPDCSNTKEAKLKRMAMDVVGELDLEEYDEDYEPIGGPTLGTYVPDPETADSNNEGESNEKSSDS